MSNNTHVSVMEFILFSPFRTHKQENKKGSEPVQLTLNFSSVMIHNTHKTLYYWNQSQIPPKNKKTKNIKEYEDCYSIDQSSNWVFGSFNFLRIKNEQIDYIPHNQNDPHT